MRFAFIILMASLYLQATAQKIQYEISFPNAAHHEAQVALTVSGIPKTAAVFRMSRSSPGRYATHEFGKNVYDVKAFNRAGAPITVNRTDGDVYEVPGQDGFVKLTYTLYGNYADGTYAGIDPQSIHLNMPATFMWIRGMDKAPIEIKFIIPAGTGNKIATQLKPTSDPFTFTAPGLQYFMDSPVKIGDLLFSEWDAANPDGKSYHFRVALDITEGKETANEFGEKVKKLVQETKAVFGEFPQFDYGTYTFLTSINPYVHGDGMEHRNSTMISSSAAFNGSNRFLGTFAHEFFHCWNVERIRPKTLEPFDFAKSNMSNELWLAEGFTQYYGGLLMERAGFTTAESYTGSIESLVNTKLNSIGATQYSPIDASRHAVFVDAGVSVDRANYANMFTSYYTYGAAIALALDLELRSRFSKTLDNFMQALWKRFGKPEIPYTVATVQDELSRLTNASFASDFFAKYIYGHQPIDYTSLLAKAGYVVKKASTKAWMGNTRFTETPKGLQIASSTIKNSPLYNAGLDADDIIETIAGQSAPKQADITSLLDAHKPGDAIQISYTHRGQQKTATVTLMENPAYTVMTFEGVGMALPAEAKRLREAWLGSGL